MRVEGSQDPSAASPGRDARVELRRMCHELEAVFLRQLFEAMRTTSPEEGSFASSPGEEMFTALLDDRLASEAAQKMKRGLGEALYRQLSRQLSLEDESCQGCRQ